MIPFRRTLHDGEPGKKYKIIAVKDNSSDFLKYVDKLGIAINDEVTIVNKESFDDLTTIQSNGQERVLSPKVTDNLFVVCASCQKAKECDC